MATTSARNFSSSRIVSNSLARSRLSGMLSLPARFMLQRMDVNPFADLVTKTKHFFALYFPTPPGRLRPGHDVQFANQLGERTNLFLVNNNVGTDSLTFIVHKAKIA